MLRCGLKTDSEEGQLRIVELDGKMWKTPLDFYQSLFDGIEQGYPHGMSADAFAESMIWRGMGGIEPPYTIRVVNIREAPKEVKDEVAFMVSFIKEAREERLNRHGIDVEVSITSSEV